MSGSVDFIQPQYNSIKESPQLANMSDEAFVASQLDIQMNEFDIASAKMKLYQIEQNNYYNLKHIQEANKEELIFIAKSKARQLADITHNQAFVDFTLSLIRGSLSIAGVTQADHIQKLLTGVAEAFGMLSYMGKTYLDSKKIPVQTELELIKGSKIPELDRYARDYFDTLRELKEALRRLADMEMDTVHNIHRN